MTDAPEKKYWPYWTCPKCGAGLHGVITQADVQGRVLGFSVLMCFHPCLSSHWVYPKPVSAQSNGFHVDHRKGNTEEIYQ